LLGGDFFAALGVRFFSHAPLGTLVALGSKLLGWSLTGAFLALSFAVIYYWAPDVKTRRLHWLTPGGAIGIAAVHLINALAESTEEALEPRA